MPTAQALGELRAVGAVAVRLERQRGGLQPRPQRLAQQALQQRHEATGLGRLPLRPTDEPRGGLVYGQAVEQSRKLLTKRRGEDFALLRGS